MRLGVDLFNHQPSHPAIDKTSPNQPTTAVTNNVDMVVGKILAKTPRHFVSQWVNPFGGSGKKERRWKQNKNTHRQTNLTMA